MKSLTTCRVTSLGVGFKFSICSSCQRLTNLRKKRLEDAIDHIFSRVGGLDEPQTA
jgi:hypothetical protein